jgi:chromosome partitioning protein
VGKTTTAINLAAALSLRGKPTLLVDLDPQANSTMSYLDAGAGDAQRVRRDFRARLHVQGRHPAVDAAESVGGSLAHRAREAGVEAGRRLDAHFRLKDRLEPIRADYPNIVIDCPPTLGS